MFDFGLAELLLVAIVAILVIGPKELPVVMMQIGRLFKRLNYLRFALSNQFDEFMKDAGLDDAMQDVNFEDKRSGDEMVSLHEDAILAEKSQKKPKKTKKTAEKPKKTTNDAKKSVKKRSSKPKEVKKND